MGDPAHHYVFTLYAIPMASLATSQGAHRGGARRSDRFCRARDGDREGELHGDVRQVAPVRAVADRGPTGGREADCPPRSKNRSRRARCGLQLRCVAAAPDRSSRRSPHRARHDGADDRGGGRARRTNRPTPADPRRDPRDVPMTQPRARSPSRSRSTCGASSDGPGLPLDLVVTSDRARRGSTPPACPGRCSSPTSMRSRAPSTRGCAARAARRRLVRRVSRLQRDQRRTCASSPTLAPGPRARCRRSAARSTAGRSGRCASAARRRRHADADQRHAARARVDRARWSTTCVADRLVRDYDSDPAIRAFVDHARAVGRARRQPRRLPVLVEQRSLLAQEPARRLRRRSQPQLLGRVGRRGLERQQSVAETYRGEYAFSRAGDRSRCATSRSASTSRCTSTSTRTASSCSIRGATRRRRHRDRDRFAAIGDRMASAIFAQHETRYTLMSGRRALSGAPAR